MLELYLISVFCVCMGGGGGLLGVFCLDLPSLFSRKQENKKLREDTLTKPNRLLYTVTGIISS